MASTLLLHALIPLILSLTIARADIPLADITSDQLSLLLNAGEMEMSIYDVADAIDEDDELVAGGRSLLWWRMRYYISYGALSANRVPCPPRSGRSYYTPNCWRARGPARPYRRGCSTITRCRR